MKNKNQTKRLKYDCSNLLKANKTQVCEVLNEVLDQSQIIVRKSLREVYNTATQSQSTKKQHKNQGYCLINPHKINRISFEPNFILSKSISHINKSQKKEQAIPNSEEKKQQLTPQKIRLKAQFLCKNKTKTIFYKTPRKSYTFGLEQIPRSKTLDDLNNQAINNYQNFLHESNWNSTICKQNFQSENRMNFSNGFRGYISLKNKRKNQQKQPQFQQYSISTKKNKSYLQPYIRMLKPIKIPRQKNRVKNKLLSKLSKGKDYEFLTSKTNEINREELKLCGWDEYNNTNKQEQIQFDEAQNSHFLGIHNINNRF